MGGGFHMRANEKSQLASVHIPHYSGIDFQNKLENHLLFEMKQDQETGCSQTERNALKKRMQKG
jgi:hypothetical protein